MALVAVHLFAGRPIFAPLRRPGWLSFACGAAAAYVFIHVLPVLNLLSAELAREDGLWPEGEWIFVAALAGTCAYHAVDVSNRRSPREGGPLPRLSRFWTQIVAFALYNGLIGATFVLKPYANALDALLYHSALVLHFAAIDQTLHRRNPQAYDRVGRWIMAAAVPVGWGLGHSGIGYPFVMALLFAFLTGGMILNVLAHEVSETGQRTLMPFLSGAGLFGLVFLFGRSV